MSRFGVHASSAGHCARARPADKHFQFLLPAREAPRRQRASEQRDLLVELARAAGGSALSVVRADHSAALACAFWRYQHQQFAAAVHTKYGERLVADQQASAFGARPPL